MSLFDLVLKWIREQIHLNQQTVQELEEHVNYFSIIIIYLFSLILFRRICCISTVKIFMIVQKWKIRTFILPIWSK